LHCFCSLAPDDHTRVRLRAHKNEARDDYINANFIDGFRTPRAYIGTQGPTLETFNAFWRMVWEQNTHVVVMITHLFESGKVWH
jgi:protein tyrosine phosphatase